MQVHVLRMGWRDILFASWPLPPRALTPLLPKGLAVDVHKGEAWVSLVAFENKAIRVRGAPRFLGMDMPELNLRTYVRHEGVPGIYFFTMDADSWLSVMLARLGFQLPYHHAKMSMHEEAGGYRFRSQRNHPGVPDATFDAFYRPTGEKRSAQIGSLEEFLLERYRFYTVTPIGLARVEAEHAPWRFQEVDLEIREDSMFPAHGLPPPEGPPVAHYGAGVDVTVTTLMPA
jgi:uncharacterized protein